MCPVPFTWVFRLKAINKEGTSFLHKARCCVRGDLQDPRFDYDPEGLYAPVAPNEAIRMTIAMAAADWLFVEGGDVSNAYLYGDIDIPIIIEQPTNFSGIPEMPGRVCHLQKSMYGIRQVGEIWGPLLVQTIITSGFRQSKVDVRVIFKNVGNDFIILVIVVDDRKFSSLS